jgi:hypothetical protein
MSETKILELKLPKPLYDTLVWYMRHTCHWVSNDMVKQSASKYIRFMVEGYLKMESDNPIDAIDQIKYEMKTIVEDL